MIAPEEALAIIQSRIPLLGDEEVPLARAGGRVLREDCLADIDLPPFARATMDGYALRAADASKVPARLRLVGTIAAGTSLDRALSAGEAAKIMTGAPLPAGADAVQKIEVTRAAGDYVEIDEPVERGQFITPAGSEAARGQVVINAGTPITAAEVAVLATFGYARVRVGRRPCVAVLATGTELVEVEERPRPAQIRNSNNYALTAYAERAGAAVTARGRAEDDEALLLEKLRQALRDCEVLILSGGVSMGDYDLVKGALKKLGAEFFFEKVALRPGKPLVFGRLGETILFGLPGNPVSAAVTFNLFVRPALLQMMGATETAPTTVRAFLTERVKPARERRSYLPGQLRLTEGRAEVRRLRWGGSSDLVGFRPADALIVVPAGTEPLPPGQLVDVVILER